MRKYNLVVIIRGTVTESKAQEQIELISKQLIESGADSDVTVEPWGRREIAYDIKKERFGHYFDISFSSANTGTIDEIRRRISLNDTVLKVVALKETDKTRGFKGNIKAAEVAA